MNEGSAGVEPLPITDTLARWITGPDPARLPADVGAHLKLAILDTLGCGLFGSTQPWSRHAADAAREMAGGSCIILGSPVTAGPVAAAMANGTAIHGFELDDVHLTGQIHPGSVVVPAVLALAQLRGLPSARVLEAVAAGYETGIRLGAAAGRGHGLSGYHPTGTIGCVAAGAAAARLLGLDAERTASALALAATQASGLYSTRTGGMAKRFHAGHAASAGVTAGLLAERGFTGAAGVIETPFGGFLSTLRCDGDPASILQDLGTEWRSASVGFKIFATCASAQTIVTGVRQLRERGLAPTDLQELRVRMGRIAISNVGWPYRPADVVAAQMNGSYAAAVTLLDGEAFIDQFREDRLADPAVLDIAGRVVFELDPEIESGGLNLRHASRLLARTKDGTVFETYNAQRPGGPGSEITPAALLGKFRQLAEPVLGTAGAGRVADLVMALDDGADMGALYGALAPGAGRVGD
ncbi:MAG: MmgE/PrpD family protein [Rhodospirillales bacterium]|jgi:aconitate decarboxylase